jgi:plasmid stabilization system protein ParE
MAGKGPLIWSPEAIGDLADIWNHYAQAASRALRTISFAKSALRSGWWKIILSAVGAR